MSQKRSRRDFELDARREQAPYVLYGTPLPNVDENVRDDGSYVPTWKQEVRDEQGRKRLHGAFTGGFSAGYFNSVGSKEGWTPATFVSSRSDRAKDVKRTTQQKVEDFMDEEDVRELEESRQISMTNGFSGFGTQDGPCTQDALDDLFRPAEDSVGERLLARMGWKKGQGIGPRVLKRIDPNDVDSEMREFSPEDSAILEFEQVNNSKGLGSAADSSLTSESLGPQFTHRSTSNRLKTTIHLGTEGEGQPTRVKKILGNGSGMQSLADIGSDEEDAYELGPRVSYTRTTGKEKILKKKQHQNGGPAANLSNKGKSAIALKKLPSIATYVRKCHDGKLPLDGFVLATETDAFQALSLTDEKYEPPEVPEGWRPAKAALSTSQEPSSANPKPAMPSSIPLSQTAQSRAQLLGETPLQGKSVFDYISSASREKLVAVSGNDTLPPGLGEIPNPNISKRPSNIEAHSQIPYLNPTTASNALARLKKDKNPPYSDDLPKQGRYKDFLRYSSTPNVMPRMLPLRAPHHKADDDHIAELHEFTATGLLFKPAVGMLASRFTSASSEQEILPREESGIDATAETSAVDPSTADLITRPARLKVIDPAEEAARMGMFGIATRSINTFIPTRLLCKRFGVEMPIG